MSVAELAEAGAFAALLAVAACAAPRVEVNVRTWGTMRDVMRDGRTEGRVRIADAVRGPNDVGLGALAGLRGEIAIVGGEIWISRATAPPEVETHRGARPDDEAALLAVASVARWREIPLAPDLPLDALESMLEKLVGSRGVGDPVTAPFLVRGDFTNVEAHVLNGACPFAGEPAASSAPVRSSWATARGELVGFYSERPPGELTHHDSRLHVHLLVRDGAGFVGHVDRVRIAPGAVLCIPDADVDLHADPSGSCSLPR